jgi:PleD family two-component response regulator
MTDDLGPRRSDPHTLTAALDRIRELEAQLDKALFDVGNLRLQMDMFSITDTLTGLRNVNGIITALERAAIRSRRSKEAFALMAVDIPLWRKLQPNTGNGPTRTPSGTVEH